MRRSSSVSAVAVGATADGGCRLGARWEEFCPQRQVRPHVRQWTPTSRARRPPRLATKRSARLTCSMAAQMCRAPLGRARPARSQSHPQMYHHMPRLAVPHASVDRGGQARARIAGTLVNHRLMQCAGRLLHQGVLWFWMWGGGAEQQACSMLCMLLCCDVSCFCSSRTCSSSHQGGVLNPVTTHTIQSMHVFDDPHACVSGSGHVSKLSVQINEDAPVIAAAMPALAGAAV